MRNTGWESLYACMYWSFLCFSVHLGMVFTSVLTFVQWEPLIRRQCLLCVHINCHIKNLTCLLFLAEGRAVSLSTPLVSLHSCPLLSTSPDSLFTAYVSGKPSPWYISQGGIDTISALSFHHSISVSLSSLKIPNTFKGTITNCGVVRSLEMQLS